ncbi:MAG TPA: hypothetical protein VF941_11025 [Clostridia bacterium]
MKFEELLLKKIVVEEFEAIRKVTRRLVTGYGFIKGKYKPKELLEETTELTRLKKLLHEATANKDVEEIFELAKKYEIESLGILYGLSVKLY